MKRPTGVVFAAIVLLLLSLFQLLMAFCMAVSGALLPMRAAAGSPQVQQLPAWIPNFMYLLCVFFLALTVWGIATTVGLFRLRRWARYSVLIIGGGLALIGFTSALATCFLLLVPMPLPSSADASQIQTTQAITKVMFAVIAFFYAIICAVGVSWLIYFNRKKVREVFTAATPESPRLSQDVIAPVTSQEVSTVSLRNSRRPFLISLLAVLNMIGAGFLILSVFIPIPGLMFGFTLDGWRKAAVYLIFAVISAAIGVGLWRLQEWGRLVALGMLVIGVAQCVFYLVRPEQMVKFSADMTHRIAPMQPQLPEQFQVMLYRGSSLFSVLICVAVAAVLIRYRAAFQHPSGTPLT
jgi:uncharacterized membrane protein (DUF2068 family)